MSNHMPPVPPGNRSSKGTGGHDPKTPQLHGNRGRAGAIEEESGLQRTPFGYSFATNSGGSSVEVEVTLDAVKAIAGGIKWPPIVPN